MFRKKLIHVQKFLNKYLLTCGQSNILQLRHGYRKTLCKFSIGLNTARGFAKKENSKNQRLLWKWVGGSRCHSYFFGKSSQNSPKPVGPTDILE